MLELSFLPRLQLVLLLLVIAAFALTNGPTQPEFSNFSSKGAGEHVDLATGDFTYTVPLGAARGPADREFPITLSYQAGIRHEQEASWVGLGWSLNCGSITRVVVGFPDDYREERVRSVANTLDEQGKIDARDRAIEAGMPPIPGSVGEMSSGQVNYGEHASAWHFKKIVSQKANGVIYSSPKYMKYRIRTNNRILATLASKDLAWQYSFVNAGNLLKSPNAPEVGSPLPILEYDNHSKYNFPSQDIYHVSAPGLSGTFMPIPYNPTNTYSAPKSELDGVIGLQKDDNSVTFYNTNQDAFSPYLHEGMVFKMTDENSLNLVDAGGGSLKNIDCTSGSEVPLEVCGTRIVPIFGQTTEDQYRITGFVVTRQDGTAYWFTKPLYSLQRISVSSLYDTPLHFPPGYPETEADYEEGTFPGALREDLGTHAYTWLLTAITGPDYEKKVRNPSWDFEESVLPHDGDLGYWVTLRYKYDETSDKVVYPWRDPWYGTRTVTCDEQTDPLHSFQLGLREITYLSSIETTTDFLKFNTEQRWDGRGKPFAKVGETWTGWVKIKEFDWQSFEAKHRIEERVRKLTSIEWYSKSRFPEIRHTNLDNAVPYRKVDFDHSYTLAKKTFNSINEEGVGGQGRLTLDKVNIKAGTHSLPYSFTYQNFGIHWNHEAETDYWGFRKTDSKGDAVDGIFYNLETVTTPEGKTITVEYERDYVKSVTGALKEMKESSKCPSLSETRYRRKESEWYTTFNVNTGRTGGGYDGKRTVWLSPGTNVKNLPGKYVIALFKKDYTASNHPQQTFKCEDFNHAYRILTADQENHKVTLDTDIEFVQVKKPDNPKQPLYTKDDLRHLILINERPFYGEGLRTKQIKVEGTEAESYIRKYEYPLSGKIGILPEKGFPPELFSQPFIPNYEFFNLSWGGEYRFSTEKSYFEKDVWEYLCVRDENDYCKRDSKGNLIFRWQKTGETNTYWVYDGVFHSGVFKAAKYNGDDIVIQDEPNFMFESEYIHLSSSTPLPGQFYRERIKLYAPRLKENQYLVIKPDESFGEVPPGGYDLTVEYFFRPSSENTASYPYLEVFEWPGGTPSNLSLKSQHQVINTSKGNTIYDGDKTPRGEVVYHEYPPSVLDRIRVVVRRGEEGIALGYPANTGRLLVYRVIIQPADIPGQLYSTRSIGNQPFSHSQRTKLGSSLNRVIYPKTKVSKTDIEGNELDGSVVHNFYTIDDAVTISGIAKGIFEERDNGSTRVVEERTDILGKIKSIEYYAKGTTDPVKKVAYSYTFGSDLSDVNVSSTTEPGVTVPDDLYGKVDCKTKPLGYIRQRSFSVKKDGSRKNTVDYRRSTAYLTSKTTTVDKVAVTEEYGLFDARTGNPTLGRLISSQSSEEASPKEIRNTLHLPYSYITNRIGEKSVLKEQNLYQLPGGSITSSYNGTIENAATLLHTCPNENEILQGGAATYEPKELDWPGFTNSKASVLKPSKRYAWTGFAQNRENCSDYRRPFDWPYGDPDRWQTQNTVKMFDTYGRAVTSTEGGTFDGPVVEENFINTTIYTPRLGTISATVKNATYEECGVFTCDYEEQYTGQSGYIDYCNGWSRGQGNEAGLPNPLVEVVGYAGHFGTRGLHIRNAYGPSRDFKLLPGTDYLLSAWVKLDPDNELKDPIETKKGLVMGADYRKRIGSHLDWPIKTYSTTVSPAIGVSGQVRVTQRDGDWIKIELPISATSDISEEKWNEGYQYARVYVGVPQGNGKGETASMYVDDIRFHPTDAFVQTYYYDHNNATLVADVDVNGTATYREFDGLGRLTEVHDYEGKLLTSAEYRLVNEEITEGPQVEPPALKHPWPQSGRTGITMSADQKLTLSWFAAGERLEGTDIEYGVFVRNSASENHKRHGTIIADASRKDFSYTIENVECASTYEWYIAAQTKDGSVSQSPFWSFKTASVEVIRPKGKEVRQTGDVLEVEYEVTKPNHIPLITELSKNAGQTWETITLDRDGNWPVQNITSPSDKCLVRVSLDCSSSDCYPCSDVSDGFFSLSPVTEEDIWIIPPEEGEDVIYDINNCDAIPIRWENVPEGVEAVNIQIYPRFPEEGDEWEYLNAGAPDRPIRRTDPDWGAFDAPVVSHNWIPDGNTSGYDWQIRLIAAEGRWTGRKSAYVKVKADASTCVWEDDCNDCDDMGDVLIDSDVICNKGDGTYTVSWSVNEKLKEPFHCFDAVRIMAIAATGDVNWRNAARTTVEVGAEEWPSKDATGSMTFNLPYSNMGVIVRLYSALRIEGELYSIGVYREHYKYGEDCYEE